MHWDLSFCNIYIVFNTVPSGHPCLVCHIEVYISLQNMTDKRDKRLQVGFCVDFAVHNLLYSLLMLWLVNTSHMSYVVMSYLVIIIIVYSCITITLYFLCMPSYLCFVYIYIFFFIFNEEIIQCRTLISYDPSRRML